jgi:hypothetical protein
MLCMTRRFMAGCMCATMCFLSCSQPNTTQRSADGRISPLKNRIPPADPSKYRSVLEANGWQNPCLIIKVIGIEAWPTGADKNPPTMTPVDVVGYLEKLPSTAWSYGLVVGVQEAGLRNPGDDAQIKRNREELIRVLHEAGVVELWPS